MLDSTNKLNVVAFWASLDDIGCLDLAFVLVTKYGSQQDTMKQRTQLNIIITPELKQRIADSAWRLRLTQTELVIRAVEAFVENEEQHSNKKTNDTAPLS